MASRTTSQARATGHVAQNIRTIAELERAALTSAGRSERLSLAIGRFVGSLPFVLAHAAAFATWAVWNAVAPQALRFDPFPYPLLTFIVSLEGVLVGTFVLITQNRMSRQSDARDQLNLQIDLLAEQEMTIVLRLLQRISERLQVEPDPQDAEQAEALTQATDVQEIAEAIEQTPDQRDG
jgi:uncharacterized membrane protein